jgi:Spy/CpxP family protein refolding chaperone
MKTLLLAGAAVGLLVAASLSPAMALGPKLSSGNTWPGISQRADTGSANAATTTPHYEYQYGCDKHAAWRGHWVLVR